MELSRREIDKARTVWELAGQRSDRRRGDRQRGDGRPDGPVLTGRRALSMASPRPLASIPAACDGIRCSLTESAAQ
jgi:hypothetical protein